MNISYRHLIASKLITQKQAAQICGVNVRTLSKWLKYNKMPDSFREKIKNLDEQHL